jgi:D-beta-D-heptose 7-phosphate kinase/D-beta-D-heptose 1-phosphate adenosyltransferase
MNPADLAAHFDRLGHPRLLVLGDLILDRYTFGNAERVSQEAPVILLRAESREARLGGAANVANMLRGLEAEAVACGVVGQDGAADEARRLLADSGIDDAGVLVDPARPTTVKERFIGRAAGRTAGSGHQILRVDCESRAAILPALERALAERALAALPHCRAVLVSDYDKGVCTPGLLRTVIDAARAAGLAVLVDPIRGQDYSRYRGATTLTPNRLEAELATGIKVADLAGARAAGQALCRTLDLELALVTLDRDGILAVWPDGRSEHFATRPRQVFDITGAGDIVLAMFGLCFAAGVPVDEACRLANVAGGLEVEKVGVARVSREEIRADLARGLAAAGTAAKQTTLEHLLPAVAAHRAAGRRIVFTNGCFDLLHVGHVTYLTEAATRGDVLIVGLNSDSSVRNLKGPTRPVIGQADRSAMLAALACVDHVVLFDEPTPLRLIEGIRPDVLVKGGDYRHKLDEITGRELVESYGGELYLAALVEGVSTTKILKSVAA